MIGCRCATCRSTDPRDRRSRPSIYIELADGTRVLVDTTPDLRAQALAYDIAASTPSSSRTATPTTSWASTRCAGSTCCRTAAIPCYGDARTMQRDCGGRSRTSSSPPSQGGGVPQIHAVPGRRAVLRSGRQEVVPVPVLHGTRTILGYRLGDFAYLTDCSGIPDASWPLLEGARHAGARRAAPPAAPDALHRGRGAGRRRAARRRAARYFTHICHDLPHAATSAALPAGVELAYDGLTWIGGHELECWLRAPGSIAFARPWNPSLSPIHAMIVTWTSSDYPDDPRPAGVARSRCWRSATSTACTAAT